MKTLEKFFIWCSGANSELMEKCPTDSGKYVGIGGTIFFTGLFAFLAASYALFTVFDNIWIGLLCGLFWGLMIFNLDRFIVSSMRKQGAKGKEFLTALPRIILAVVISIVIAKPLEMKLFEKEIKSEIGLMEEELYAVQEGQVKNRFTNDRSRIQNEIATLKSEIDDKTAKRDELMEIARQEADGTGGTKQRNAGPIYKIKKAEADKVDQELKELSKKNLNIISAKYQELNSLDTTMTSAITALSRNPIDGPAGRMQALSRLTEKNAAIWWANWFIVLLFIVVETAPIFVKLISSKGPYDQLLDAVEFGFDSERTEALAKVNATVKERSTHLPVKEKDYITDRLDIGLDRT